MKRRVHGPSLYYATDKNVFDALNLHKVDSPTVARLFQRRNIIVSRKTEREELASYFARLTHDYYDHKDIAARLGIAARRERTTSMDVIGDTATDDFQAAVESLKSEMESNGDVLQISRDGDNLTVNVQYTDVDYRRNEFSQVQVKDGTIEFIKSADGFVVRNTQNEYLNEIRESVLSRVEKSGSPPLEKVTVSLFDVPSAKLRSKFFHSLALAMPGFLRRDVTDVYVFKAKPAADATDEDDGFASGDPDTHIERVMLRGNGVSRAEMLNQLLEEEDYHITKMGWTTVETMGSGHVYEIEAMFADPKDCAAFSFIVRGVYPLEEGKISPRRRTPNKHETNSISRVIEVKSRELIAALKAEFASTESGEG